MATIRMPRERLADCCWLPRFADKARALLAGELPFLYRAAFASPLGVDGFFLRHFQINRGDFIRAVRSTVGDEALAVWFLTQPHVSAATIDEWNRNAPRLGAQGQPGRWIFLTVRWFMYPRTLCHPATGMFSAVEQDEA